MMLIIFLLLGLIIGSFLNVLVYRLRFAEELFWDRSKCPHCQHMIRWYDNMPVISFILLKFRCRDCKQKISYQYPLVEIFTGLVFSLVGYVFFKLENPATWFVTFYYLLISGSLISILVYDWLYMEIPGEVLWVTVGLAVLYNLIIDWASFGDSVSSLGMTGGILGLQTYAGALAAFGAFLFFLLLSSLSREKWMGMGDSYLAILLGLVVGFPKILLALFLAFFIGAIYGMLMMVIGKKKMKSQIPFAPFLVLGTFMALFFFAPITNWYWGFFG